MSSHKTWFKSLLAIFILHLANPASALEIQINQELTARTLQKDQLYDTAALGPGTVIEIPNKYRRANSHGVVEARLSLNAWLDDVGYAADQIEETPKDERYDFFFPVVVVKPNGSGTKNLKGKIQYLALRQLMNKRGALTVLSTSTTIADKMGDVAPLQSAEDPAELPAADLSTALEPKSTQTISRPTIPQTDNPTNSQREAQSPCLTCQTETPAETIPPQVQQMISSADAIGDEADQEFSDEAKENKFSGLPRSFGGLCDAFIKPDGTYGSTGKTVLKEISEDENYMSPDNGVSRMCPRFNHFFSPEQKRNFWVWVFASLAYQESRCQTSMRLTRAPVDINPNGHAAGLFQIEEQADLRAGRDSLYGGKYCSGNPYSVSVNVRCAVRMLSTPLRKGMGPYSTKNQYWSSFLKKNTKAKARIAQYKACFGSSK